MKAWGLAERERALAGAERDGLDLLVIGGGISGAGILRDAASRGMRAFLVERDDFASGTSSRSSKMVHGGLRYIAEGQLAVTRESCRERDLLLRQNPNLVRPLPFLFPAYAGGKHPLWQIRAALWTYAALANFRRTARFEMLGPDAVRAISRDLRRDGLLGAGLYHDAQVDDARLVLESLKSARNLGADCANHAEAVEFERDDTGRLSAVRVRDALSGRSFRLRARAIVNAAGPCVERLRGLDRPLSRPELRPAKGVHLVLRRSRVHLDAAVTFEAADRRQLFLEPWDDDFAILGTTDSFSSEIDEPTVSIEDVHYLLAAANEAFPAKGLTTNDLVSVFAGVRPLVDDGASEQPPSSVSREHRIYEDPSGLLSIAGGKLTTYRAMGQAIVDRAIRLSPALREARIGRSRSAEVPLREDSFDRGELEAGLRNRFHIAPKRADHLVRTYGEAAEALLADAPEPLRRPIGRTRFTWAEIPWIFRTECTANLCDLLERRMRMALFAPGQGLPELEHIARLAGEATGWDATRVREETTAYAETVRRRYQIVAPPLREVRTTSRSAAA
jgi:glycerol-3-phosphate dehydrogenase